MADENTDADSAVIERLRDMLQSCEELEAALRGALAARVRFDADVRRVAERLGEWLVRPASLPTEAAEPGRRRA